ncbi:hypothetical protein ACJJTC_008800 [Scirpophaga incertulas]
MICRAVFVLCLAVAVLAQYQVTDDQRQKIKDAIATQCKKNGAEDKAEQVETAGKNFIDCMKGLFNVETIKQEIEEAKPNGALDEVFGKYCAKSPQLKSCIHNAIEAVSPCLDATVRAEVGSITNATDHLIDFVCYKDGDRIALFIAENGPECFQEKTDAIRTCGEKLRESLPTVEAAKSLTLTEQCGKFDELTTCVVKALEECSTPTPGNMAESLFRFVREGSPCRKKA